MTSYYQATLDLGIPLLNNPDGYNWNYAQDRPSPPRQALKIASLFSGAGFFVVGALERHIPIWGVDYDPSRPEYSEVIAETYRKNVRSEFYSKTVQELVKTRAFSFLPTPDILQVSPPCVSFSLSNKNSETELDLELAKSIVTAIQQNNPPRIVFENVPSYLVSQSWSIIRQALIQLGYNVFDNIIVNSATMGVSQKRCRFFGIAYRKSVKFDSLPLYGFLNKNEWQGWGKAIAGIELPTCELTSTQLNNLPKLKKHKSYLIERVGTWKQRNLLVKPEGDPSWTLRASLGETGNGERKNFINVYGREINGKRQVYYLNARAFARLFSVPDWVKIPEDTIDFAVRMLGNCVPPLVSTQVLKCFE